VRGKAGGVLTDGTDLYRLLHEHIRNRNINFLLFVLNEEPQSVYPNAYIEAQQIKTICRSRILTTPYLIIIQRTSIFVKANIPLLSQRRKSFCGGLCVVQKYLSIINSPLSSIIQIPINFPFSSYINLIQKTVLLYGIPFFNPIFIIKSCFMDFLPQNFKKTYFYAFYRYSPYSDSLTI